MEENLNTLHENIEELYKQSKFEEIIALLTDEVLERLVRKDKVKAAELYVWRGTSLYNLKKYDEAIKDYNKAIVIIPQNEFAFYNRGLARFAKKEYDKAIEDYNLILNLNSDCADEYYNVRGSAWKKKNKYDKAIADYTKAIEIKPDFGNAYYNRGLAKKEKDTDLKGSKQDFEKYLELTLGENDIWYKYAKYYINELSIWIKDPELWSIRQSINDIKKILMIKGKCITHYTSLSVLKSLILDKSKFRISEGNFMNDPSEGKEFFNFLQHKFYNSRKNVYSTKTFSPKPFIGSFVSKDMHDNLNLWRFYGKEKGVEAKGCAITLRMQKFIEDIENWLINEKKEARQGNETDIKFYRVVYVAHCGDTTKFYVPNPDKNKELESLMEELKKKVNTYKGGNTIYLEEYLNSIAFLFKSDAYKNENEVRLVVKGIEFDKEYNMDISSPKVYIELVSIKDIVSQITLGPKVDKVSEWITAFHYCYEKLPPKIMMSHVPYK
jgi:tetratricopeptide (TPR) repeat protein